MKIEIQISLKDDFNTLCSIYEINPETMLQSFIDQISFPRYYSKDDEIDKWAILFFLSYLDSDEYEDRFNDKKQDYYLSLFTAVVNKNLDDFPNDRTRAEDAGRKIMTQWQKAVLAERARYLTDNL